MHSEGIYAVIENHILFHIVDPILMDVHVRSGIGIVIPYQAESPGGQDPQGNPLHTVKWSHPAQLPAIHLPDAPCQGLLFPAIPVPEEQMELEAPIQQTCQNAQESPAFLLQVLPDQDANQTDQGHCAPKGSPIVNPKKPKAIDQRNQYRMAYCQHPEGGDSALTRCRPRSGHLHREPDEQQRIQQQKFQDSSHILHKYPYAFPAAKDFPGLRMIKSRLFKERLHLFSHGFVSFPPRSPCLI